MQNLKEIVKRGREGPGLMFRSQAYDLSTPDDFLADIMALANADIMGQRALIIGVVPGEPGARKIQGIQRERAPTGAGLQKLVDEFIEPGFDLSVATAGSGARTVLVIMLNGCDSPPYLLKRPCGALLQGVGFIRKGSENMMLSREESKRLQQGEPSEPMPVANGEYAIDDALAPAASVTFGDGSRIARLPVNSEESLPSSVAARKLKAAIEARTEVEKLSGLDTGMVRLMHVRAFGPDEPFAKKSLDELRDDLRKVREKFADDDKVHRFEKAGHRLNFQVHNNGERALRNARLVLRMARQPGLELGSCIYALEVDPESRKRVLTESHHPGYPSVAIKSGHFEIAYALGDVTAGQHVLAFREPLRVWVSEPASGQSIPIECELSSPRLESPIVNRLELQMVAAGGL